jgi:hypothetical protein
MCHTRVTATNAVEAATGRFQTQLKGPALRLP